MSDWWMSLSVELQVFYLIGIVSFLVTVIQMSLTLIGLGGESVDFDLDIPEDGHATGIGLFSSQTIAAFFLGFGWSGVIFIKMGLHILLAVFLAFNVGGLLMAAMYFLLVGLLSLQSRGNLNYADAVGATGEVYVTIPPSRSGQGQIQVIISGRLTTVGAETDSETAIGPGKSVRITARLGTNDFIVETL